MCMEVCLCACMSGPGGRVQYNLQLTVKLSLAYQSTTMLYVGCISSYLVGLPT